MYNVLVFPGGTEIGLEIHRSLAQCKDIRLFSAGSDVSNHAPYVFARHFVIPSVRDSGWIDSLNEVIVDQSINYIFPAHDDVLAALSQNADKIKARVISSPLDTCLITRSKLQTYRLFSDVLPTPKVYDDPVDVDQFPVFVKPDKGQGSQNAQIVDNAIRLANFVAKNEGYLILEYLPGDEYTVDCFSDRKAGLLFCGGRQRVRIRNGISVNSRLVCDRLFRDYANVISQKLVFHGAWFFQLKKDCEGNYKLLEIAPRIAGTMAIHRVQGVNFPLLSIYEQERVPIEILTNDSDVEIDRALINRYRHQVKFDTVYVDLDDTLILNGRVNVDLIRFLYQCVNFDKRIILLTKHDGDVDAVLRKHRLSAIFDEIIHIKSSNSKCDAIQLANAILIDDSFSERKRVAKDRGILTFDSSMIEMLADDKV